jgi:hypothetical protein
VPLPEPRIDLDQLQTAVPGIPFPLHLRDSVEGELLEQTEPRLDDLLVPECLADPRAAHVHGRLAKLPAGEHRQRAAVGSDVRAERPEPHVAARDELLHHRLVVGRCAVRVLELVDVVADERLPLVDALEDDVL